MLLIRRAHPPDEGSWSLPGGRVEDGETDEQAVAREVREETGLEILVGAPLGSVSREGPGGSVYDIHDYAATVSGGELEAGDDAGDARWVHPDELTKLPLTGGLLETLTAWGVT